MCFPSKTKSRVIYIEKIFLKLLTPKNSRCWEWSAQGPPFLSIKHIRDTRYPGTEILRASIKALSHINSTVTARHLEQFGVANCYHHFLNSKCHSLSQTLSISKTFLRPFKILHGECVLKSNEHEHSLQ